MWRAGRRIATLTRGPASLLRCAHRLLAPALPGQRCGSITRTDQRSVGLPAHPHAGVAAHARELMVRKRHSCSVHAAAAGVHAESATRRHDASGCQPCFPAHPGCIACNEQSRCPTPSLTHPDEPCRPSQHAESPALGSRARPTPTPSSAGSIARTSAPAPAAPALSVRTALHCLTAHGL